MYNDHFGLRQAPFRITPDTRYFFTGGGRGEILEALTYAVVTGEGIVKVVGEVGTGKTMLCRMLENSLPEDVEIVYLANPSLTPDDIVTAIALELNVPVDPAAPRVAALHALHKALVERHASGRRVVALVEEAQSMPLATLEEIRLLSNLETQREKLLQIVLFGQPELDEKLDDVSIRQLRERITHSFHLARLDRAEIKSYVNFRLRAAGYKGPELFHRRAYRALARAAEGLTRRVNILADKALLAAFSEDAYQVTRRHVRIAVRDSEFGRTRRGGRGWIWGFATVTLALLLAGTVVLFLEQRWIGTSLARNGTGASLTLPAPGAAGDLPAPDSGPDRTGASDSTLASNTAPRPLPGASRPAAQPTDIPLVGPAAVRQPDANPDNEGISGAGPRSELADSGSSRALSDRPMPSGTAAVAPPAVHVVNVPNTTEAAMNPAPPVTPGQPPTTAAPGQVIVAAAAVAAAPQTLPASSRPVASPVSGNADPTRADARPGVGVLGPARSRQPLRDREPVPAPGLPLASAAMDTPAPGCRPGEPAPSQTGSDRKPERVAAIAVAAGSEPVQVVRPVADGVASSEGTGDARPGASVAAVSAPTPPTPPAPAGGAVPTGQELLGARLAGTRRWLTEVEPANYSIQIMATPVSQQNQLEAFLSRHATLGDRILENIFVYETVIKESRWYGVLYGEFAGYSVAKQTLADLPASMRRHRPFIRNISDIDAIR